ncbi:hypothetical protein KIAC18_003960 [Sporomusa sphaeroides]|uniref:hypothetical protein n=1 Tax=Sporomusa sphaeroides TaxID=47679 RepID=UPI003D9FF380
MSNPEYLAHRCCMCPNSYNESTTICPGIPNTFHTEDSLCRFVKTYVDERGWKYFVRKGIGPNYKTFYKKPGKTGDGHGCRLTEWRESFNEAQSDLNKLAKAKGWQEI